VKSVIVNERIGDFALIEKVVANQLPAISSRDSRLYVQMDWICKRWPTYEE